MKHTLAVLFFLLIGITILVFVCLVITRRNSSYKILNASILDHILQISHQKVINIYI